MTEAEVEEYLAGRRTMNMATIGPDGRPHLVAMWYGFADGAPAVWTYGRSQKIRNLERDARITCLVESGDTYDQLRGVELVGTAQVFHDRETVQRVGESVWERYTGPVDEGASEAVATMGAKRAAIVVTVEAVVSWDHTKLGGTY